jgi:hypothetical protein
MCLSATIERIEHAAATQVYPRLPRALGAQVSIPCTDVTTLNTLSAIKSYPRPSPSRATREGRCFASPSCVGL